MRQAVLIVSLPLLLLLIMIARSSTRTATPPVLPDAESTTSRNLTVMLYPYIPDAGNDGFSGYVNRIRQEFMALYPEINLTVIMNEAINTYSTQVLQDIFTTSDVQVVELDLMMLGYAQERGWILPISTQYPLTPYLSAAQQAVTIEQTVYAMPSRVCSLFLFAYDEAVMNATNTTEYLQIMRQIDPNQQYLDLVGEFYGSTSLPTYYTAFFTGNYGFANMAYAFIDFVDPLTIQLMAETFNECTQDGENRCLGEYYKTEPQAAIDFATGVGLTYIGFSEALNWIENTNSVPPFVNPAPLGTQTNPVMYVDGLVVNAQACDDQCQADAELFGMYYASTETQLWMNLALDVPGSVPRYLLAADYAFYEQPQVQAYPVYDVFLATAEVGAPFPNQGFPEAQSQMFPAICSAINYYLGFQACGG